MSLSLSTTLEFKITNTSPIVRIPLVKGSLLNHPTANLEVDWGDGSAVSAYSFSDNTAVELLFHKYDTIPGNNIVTVKIYGGWGWSGKFGFCKFDERPEGHTMNKLYKVTSQENFWIHGQGDFKDCTELVSLNKVWGKFVKDQNQKFELIDTFAGCSALVSGLGSWKLDGCTKLEGVLKGTQVYQEWIRGWNISEVTSMKSLFEGSAYNNKSICGWTMTAVEDTSSMFKSSNFNQWVNTWFPQDNNNLKIENISYMFENSMFDSKLSDWNLKSVTDASYCFKDTGYNGYLESWFNNKGGTKTFTIQNIKGMFEGSAFNNRLANWDVTTVTDASDLFKNNTSYDKWIMNWFKQPAGGGKTWAIETLAGMFEGANAFNQKLSNWDLTTVKDLSRMFKNNTKYNQFIKPWFPERVNASTPESRGDAPAAVEHLDEMFAGNTAFNQKINTWDVRAVKTASGMFKDNTKFTQFLGTWFDTTSGPQTFALEDASSMFEGSIYNNNLSKWNMNTVKNASRMFANTTEFDQYIEPWFQKDGSTISHAVENVSGIFAGAQKYNKPTGKWDLRAVTDASDMFKGTVLFNQPVSNLFKSADGIDPVVEDISGMFDGAAAFNQKITDWNLSTAKNASKMFANNTKYNQWMNTLFATSNDVEDVSGMFENSTYNGVLSNWKFFNATNASNMFKNNPTFNQYIEPMFNDASAKIEDLSGMFEGAGSFNKKLTNWKLTTAVTLKDMFKDSAFNGDIGEWFKTNDKNIPSPHALKDISGMFSGTSKYGQGTKTIAQKINQWDVRTVKSIDGIFNANEHFDGWMRNWNSSKPGGLKTVKTIGTFATKSGWGGKMNEFIADVEQTYNHTSVNADIVNTSVTTGTVVIQDIYHDLFVKLDNEPFVPTPGMVRVGQAPPVGDLVLEVIARDTVRYTYTVLVTNDTDITIPITTPFTIIYTGDDRMDQTLDLSGDTVPVTAAQPDPVAVEFRWKEITVSDNGASVNVTVLQAKNLLTPTHNNWVNDTTGWWTLYGYAGDENLRSTYNLGSQVWPDAGVQSDYGSFHPASVTLPEGGTITFSQGDNTDYLQLHYTPDGDYEFNGDVSAGNGELFLFFGDIDGDSGTVSADWPLPRRKATSGPVPLVPATPQSDTGTGTVTGDLTKELMAGPSWDGYVYGDIAFEDLTHGHSYASNSDAQNKGYAQVVGTATATNTTGGITADVYYEWNTSGMRWSFQTGDGHNWRGDGTFTIEWINDRSAQLQEDDMNGNIPGGYASYSDPANGISFTSYNEGTDYNLNITADGSTELWELIKNAGAWEGFEWEYDFGNTTGATDPNEGWSTHVYPAGTVIDVTGGADPGLQEGTTDYNIAYNEKNSIEIRLRVSDAVDGGPGTATGDTDVSMLYTQGMFNGLVTFDDPDGVSNLDGGQAGWSSAGSMAKPGTSPRGTFTLIKNTYWDTGKYDYVTDTQGSFPYVDEFQITWQDDSGFTNTTDIKFTVDAPGDQVGVWSGDSVINITGQDPSSWIDPANDPNGEAYYVQSIINLSDQDGLGYNDPTVTVPPTKGTVQVSRGGSYGARQMYVDYYPGQTAGASGPETDTATFEWIDDMGHSNTITFTFNISQYTDPFANPTGNTGNVAAWETNHPTQGIPSSVSGVVQLPGASVGSMVSYMSISNGPTHGTVSNSGGTSWQYQPQDGISDVTDTWDMNWMIYNTSDSSTVYGSTTVTVVVGSLAGITDTPGTVTGSSQLTGTVNSNNTVQDNNSVYGSLYYADVDGVNNLGDPESIKTPPTRGNASINYGSWMYVPNQGESGSDSFVVQWSDDQGFTNDTTINITIVDTSNKASNISGDVTLSIDAVPLDPHSGNDLTWVTGTLTVTDDNGFDEPGNTSSPPNIAVTTGLGAGNIDSWTRVDPTTLSITWAYNPFEEEVGNKTARVQWTDNLQYTGYVDTTIAVTAPAAVDRTINSSSPNLGAIFNNQSSPTYDSFAGDGDAVFEIISTQGAPQLANTIDGYTYQVSELPTLNTYQVSIGIDTSYNWPTKVPSAPSATFSENLTININDGFGRPMTPLTVSVAIRSFVDTGGSISLVDPAGGQDNIADTWGQEIITNGGISSLKLFNPAPMGSGIKAGIVFTDVAGVANVSTITVDNVDTTQLEPIVTSNENGYLTVEVIGKQTGTGSFNVTWADDLGNINVDTIAYEIVDLPDITGTIVSVTDSADQAVDAPNGTYILPASYEPVAFTVSVDDINGIGPATILSQPAEGSFSMTTIGVGYLATYTPPLSTENLAWVTADMSFKWEDADGNENDTVNVTFQQESPQYSTPHTGTEDEVNMFITIDGISLEKSAFDARDYYGGPNPSTAAAERLFEVEEGGQLTGQMAFNDGNGIPYPGEALFYSQPTLPGGGSGGSLQLTENITDDLDPDMPYLFNGVTGDALVKNSGGNAPQTRVFDLSFQAPQLPEGEDYIDLSVNFTLISYRGTGENEITFDDMDDRTGSPNAQSDLKIRVYKGAGSYLELEYSEPVNAADIPPHDGTATAVGNTVQVTGFTRMGWAGPSFEGDSAKQTAAGKLIAINQFGPGNNIDWSYAFHSSLNLAHVPSVMPGSSNIDGMFYGCTSLTEIVADQWDTSSLTSLERVFINCTNLTKLYARDWDVSSVTTFVGLFANTGFTSVNDIVGLLPNSPTGWDFSSAESFEEMFMDSNLAGAVLWTNMETGSNLTNLNKMFAGTNVTAVTLNPSFNSVTSIKGMFEGTNLSSLPARYVTTATGSTIGAENWDTSNVTDMSDLFKGVTAMNININSDYSFRGVTDASGMFEETTNLTGFSMGYSGTQAYFPSITSPDGFKNMFKNSALVNPGASLGGWETPGLTGIPQDLLGEGVPINSNWTLNLEMGGNPNNYTITNPTFSVVDSNVYFTNKGAGEPAAGKFLFLDNYKHPENTGGLFLDWRRETLSGSSSKPYMVVKISNNGTTLNFLADGGNYTPAMHYSDQVENQACGGWEQIGYQSQGRLFLTLTNFLQTGNAGPDGRTYTYGNEGQDYDAYDPAHQVFLDSKPAWVANLGATDHPLNINLSQWLGLGTPTRAQVDAMLPANLSDNIKITIEVHDSTGGGSPITIVDNDDISAGDFVDVLEYAKVTQSIGNEAALGDASHNASIGPPVVPYKFGRLKGNAGTRATLPVGNPAITHENVAQYIAGAYDDPLAESGFLEPLPFILNIINTKHEFYASWNDMFDSCFYPEFEITGFEPGVTYDNNTLKTKLAGIPFVGQQLIEDHISRNDYQSMLAWAKLPWGMNGKNPEIKVDYEGSNSWGSLEMPDIKWFVDYPENDYSIGFTTTSKYNTNTRSINYYGWSGSSIDFSSGAGKFADGVGITSPTVNYVEFEWTDPTSKVFIPSISDYLNDMNGRPAKRIYDFDPDGTAGLASSERYFIAGRTLSWSYNNTAATYNIPSGMKGAKSWRHTNLASFYDGQNNLDHTVEEIPGIEALNQSYVDSNGYNHVPQAVAEFTTTNRNGAGVGYDHDDMWLHNMCGQVIFEYTDSAKPRKVRIYDEVGGSASQVGYGVPWSGHISIMNTIGPHFPEYTDSSGNMNHDFHFGLSQNISWFLSLGYTLPNGEDGLAGGGIDIVQAGEWYNHSADKITFMNSSGNDHKWFWWYNDNTATVATDVLKISTSSGGSGGPVTIP